jgi:hypothetical protein
MLRSLWDGAFYPAQAHFTKPTDTRRSEKVTFARVTKKSMDIHDLSTQME